MLPLRKTEQEAKFQAKKPKAVPLGSQPRCEFPSQHPCCQVICLHINEKEKQKIPPYWAPERWEKMQFNEELTWF